MYKNKAQLFPSSCKKISQEMEFNILDYFNLHVSEKLLEMFTYRATQWNCLVPPNRFLQNSFLSILHLILVFSYFITKRITWCKCVPYAYFPFRKTILFYYQFSVELTVFHLSLQKVIQSKSFLRLELHPQRAHCFLMWCKMQIIK